LRKAILMGTSSPSEIDGVPAHLEGQEELAKALGERQRPLIHIPLEQIRLSDNPRQNASKVALEALTASTRRVGTLGPVLVQQRGEAEYVLVAGERRFRAAKAAGRSTIPAQVIEEDEDVSKAMRLALAMIENTVREDMTAVEEAQAIAVIMSSHDLTVEGVAALMSMSDDLVEKRLALLELPREVKSLLGAGELTLKNAATLAPIAKKSAAVASALGARVASGAQSGRALDEDPAAALRRLADEEEQPEATFLIPFGSRDSVNLDEVCRRVRAAVASEQVPERSVKGVQEALAEVSKALKETPPDLRTAEILESDTDRARSFGVLIEYREGRYRRSGVLVDPVFAADWAQEAAGRIRDDGSKSAGGASSDLPEDKEDPAKRAEQRKAEVTAAKAANAHMDREIANLFDHQTEVPLAQARVMVALLLEAFGRDLAVGHRVVRGSWIVPEVKPLRGGGVRTTEHYPSVDEGPRLLEQELRRASTGPELIGRAFGAIVSAVLSDQRVLGSATQRNLELPYSMGREEQLQGLAAGDLWAEAEGCLTEPRADELRHLFVPDPDAGPSRDRLDRSEVVDVAEVLELAPAATGADDVPEAEAA